MGRPLFPAVAVNGRAISPEAIGLEAQNHEAPASKPGWAWRKAARALVVKQLLLDEAGRRGLAAEPRQVGPQRFETEEEALVRQVLEAAVEPFSPSEAEARKVYDARPDRFRAPTLYEASHVLIAADPADQAAFKAAETQAEAARARIVAGEAGFEQTAREMSACSSRESGGRLGQFSSGDMDPAFEAALDSCEPGRLASEPVATRFGWHVIRLDARADGETPPYEAVRDRIVEALEKAAWAREARRLVADLVAGADISGVEFDAVI